MRISDWSSDVCSSDLSIATAAAFIKANMPLSQGDTLTDQQAWDVAYFIDAHERPQDPRFNGSLEETRQKFHGSPNDLYGREIDGTVLGAHSTPSGPLHGGLPELRPVAIADQLE